MSVDGDPGAVDKSKKHFVPLENNPEVFTLLAHELGVSPQLGFYDVYSIDEPSLLALIPRPVLALIFISPAQVWRKRRQTDFPEGLGAKDQLAQYTGHGESEPVVWFKQTIGNACGLIALLHSLSNGPAKAYVQPDSILDNLIKAAIPLPPKERAQLLYDSQGLEKAHAAAAQKGDTIAPSSRDPNGFHFISFVRGKDGQFWELEGGAWHRPISRGSLGDEHDMLSQIALDSGVRPFLDAAKGGHGLEGALGFSIVALAAKGE